MASRLGPKGRVSTMKFPFSLGWCLLYVLNDKQKYVKKWRLDSALRAESRLPIFSLLYFCARVSFYWISCLSFHIFSSISFLIYIFYFIFNLPFISFIILISFLTTLIFIFFYSIILPHLFWFKKKKCIIL